MVVIPTCHLLHQMASRSEYLVAEREQFQSMFSMTEILFCCQYSLTYLNFLKHAVVLNVSFFIAVYILL